MLPLQDLLKNWLLLWRVYRHGWTVDAPGDGVNTGVVMGAQVLSGGWPSRTLAARTRRAAHLYAQGAFDLLIPTGGIGQYPPSEAEVMAGILKRCGVPESAVLLERRASNTRDSARRVAEMLRLRGIEEILVITDPLHCVRTIAAFEEMGIVARAEPVYDSPMWSKRWSRLGQLAREAVALAWYRTKYGIGARSSR